MEFIESTSNCMKASDSYNHNPPPARTTLHLYLQSHISIKPRLFLLENPLSFTLRKWQTVFKVYVVYCSCCGACCAFYRVKVLKLYTWNKQILLMNYDIIISNCGRWTGIVWRALSKRCVWVIIRVVLAGFNWWG